jgi:glycerophosphoryl diester phosphodiesterase
MIDKENHTNNTNSITTKPSFWGWLWFLVPWIIIVIVSLFIEAMTFSPTLIIFAAIIVVPRMISTYKTNYTISSTQINITQGSLFGAQQYELPLTKITRVQSKYGMFGKTLNYTTLLLDSTEHGIVPLNYVPNNSDFLKEVEKRYEGFTDIQTSETIQTTDDFGSIAHRGFSSQAPENTSAAFDKAIENDFLYIETDVQLTSDNIPVIIHDETVDRTSNGKGKVSEKTLSDIKKLDFGSWFSPKFKDQKILTLLELLKNYNNKIHLVLELKSDQSDLPKQVSALIENENWDKIAGNPMSQIPGLTIVSFHLEQLLRSVELMPVVRHGWLVGELTDTDIDIASKLGIQGIFPYAKMTSEHSVKYAKEKGLFVAVWGIQNAEEVVMLKKIGVSAVTTDWPDQIQEYLNNDQKEDITEEPKS